MMRSTSSLFQSLATTWKVGLFLAIRDIKRSNIWTTVLIIFIMMLTFLNLIVVRGILVGLVEGSNKAYRERYIGDLILETPRLKQYIEQSPFVISIVEGMPELRAYSARYLTGGVLEAGYREKIKASDSTESVNVIATGIDPAHENQTTHLERYVVAGSYLDPNDIDGVLVGASLLFNYTPVDTPSQRTLKGADIGSKVRLTIGKNVREVTIRGVIKTKVDAVDLRVFMPQQVLRSMLDRSDYSVGEISIVLSDPSLDRVLKPYLLANGVGQYAKVSTFDEGVPRFVKDLIVTFDVLSNIIGSIGLAVAAITIFIVIFVNAITRRKYIGILKGIGVTGSSIQCSYIIQALFYAFVGIALGTCIVFLFLKPYFAANPINFPFGDGILVADAPDVFVRAVVLFIATAIAGYIPARIVVRQNTLDAILGR
jgi:putative ABC transport system permease protein